MNRQTSFPGKAGPSADLSSQASDGAPRNESGTSGREPGVWRLSYRIAANRSDLLWMPWFGWFVFFVSPLLAGLLMRLVFDAVADLDSGPRPYVLIALFAGVEFARRLVVHSSATAWIRSWVIQQALPQVNMLECQVIGGGPHAGPLVDRPGEAVSRFRDDPHDVAWFIDSWIDVSGALVFAVGAVAVMATIDPAMALVVVVPMIGVAVLTRVLGSMVKRAHRADLDAASRVNGILRDVFQGVQVLALHGAVDDAVAEVRDRCEQRRRTAVRNRALTESISAASWSSSDVAIGLVLLVAVGSIRSGAFSLGDLALFVSYMGWFGFFPRMMGQLLTRRRQSEVGFERMGELTGSGARTVARPRPIRIDEPADETGDEPGPAPPMERRRLKVLEVRQLNAVFDGGTTIGATGLDFTVERGSLTVISGPVGSGKTTLLRALIGLIESTGSVYWNGERIDDPGLFMVPPHAAYLPQVPAMFGDTVEGNIRLAAAVAGDDVRAAVSMAALERDVADMPHGLDTIVGARGVRLSGGQRQRLAAARAMVRTPELLVIDDLSSAVDSETEVNLWNRLRADGRTVVAVSNRPLALRRADQVIELGA